MSTDYDSPWNESLDAYFEPFLALLLPVVHAKIRLRLPHVGTQLCRQLGDA